MSFGGLYDHVVADFASRGVTAAVAFGQREIAKQINQGAGRANRVVFAPGDASGSLGSLAPAEKTGPKGTIIDGVRPKRALWDWMLKGRVYVWGYDGSAPTSERAQWDAMVEVHDEVVTSIHSYQAAFYKVTDARRAGPAVVERPFGCEVMLLLELRQPVLAGSKQKTGAVIGAGTTFLKRTPETEEPGCGPHP